MNTGLELDPDLARQLMQVGGILIFLDVPPRTEFGIDLNSWNTGKKFKGVKMIPPGVHFISYSAVDRQLNTAPRTGFFHNFQQGELVAKRYDPRTEDISDTEVSDEEKERMKADLQNLDRYLGVYPYDSWKKWVSLSGRITENVLNRVQPLEKKISSVAELIPYTEDIQPETSTSRRENMCSLTNEAKEEAWLPKMKRREGTEIRFSSIPNRKYPKNATPAEVTKHSLDSSYALEVMLENFSKPEEILGEMQMAFVCFLVGQVYDAFEQWKKLVHLLCNCRDALVKHPTIFLDFISDLYFQIKEVPEDFFVDIVYNDNFLFNALQTLFHNLEDSELADRKLKTKAEKFRRHVTKKFKWDFSKESEEFEPVIVEAFSKDNKCINYLIMNQQDELFQSYYTSNIFLYLFITVYMIAIYPVYFIYIAIGNDQMKKPGSADKSTKRN